MDQGGGGAATRRSGSNSSSNKASPLRLSKESRTIRKPPVPLPKVQYRQPVIIHTYSPRVIETDATNFMWLVQRLTGSTDTRMRCKSSKPAVLPAYMPSSPTRKRSRTEEQDHEQQQQQQQQQEQQFAGSPSSDEPEDLRVSSATIDEDVDSDCLSDQRQHHFKVEQLLLSPASSTDSGNPFQLHRLGNPLLASPKSPLGFDAPGLAFGDFFSSNPFSTSSSMASNAEPPTVYVPQAAVPQPPWSPGAFSHEFLPDIDLYSSSLSSASSADLFHSLSPRGKMFGAIQSPATMAFRDMAFAFIKDAC